ncbi:MAG: efflux RND transporter periplasmic adaptor subunit [Anaerolineales bacterium]
MFRKPLFWISIIVLLAAAIGGYYYYRQSTTTAEAASATPLQTSTVKRGNLVISASGTGSVITEHEVQLGFETGGVLTKLNIVVGDEVKEGDVLAEAQPSDSAATIQSKLTSAQLSVLQAQQNLDDLNSTTTNDVTQAQIQSNLAQKQLDLIETQSTLTTLINTRATMNGKRCGSDTIASKQDAYDIALERYNRSAHLTNSTEYQQLQAAELNLNWCSSNYSQAELDAADAEIASIQASIQLMQSQILEYQTQMADLTDSSGSGSLDIAIAQAQLDNSKAQLEVVEQESISSTILAPFDGTILAISSQVGDNVGTNAFITLADLSQPYLEVLVDETDLNNIGVDYNVQVTFDALPNQIFTGKVISVDPSLIGVGNVTAVRSTVQLDTESFSKPQTLPIGLSATVEIISNQAQNVLLVPVEALRELSEGSYAVFVMENGTPVLKTVEVGLMDYTYAEIKSGLNEGDVVTTGIVETTP